MATTIFFNGRTTARPGSYSQVDATGLARPGLGATGIIALLGEVEGGQPAVALPISNPGKVGRTFREGDLVEGANILFDPSKDPNIPGGAQQVVFVKVNPATQSSATFANGDGDALTLTSSDYGLFTTQISVDIADGTNQGKAITITDGSSTDVETYDDVGGDAAFTALYVPGTDGATTMVMALDNATGATADFTKTAVGLSTDGDGGYAGISGLDSEFAGTHTATNTVDVVSSSAADTTQTVTIIGVSGGAVELEVLTLTGVSTVNGADAFDKVLGVIVSAACAGTVTVTTNTVGTTLTTLAPGVLTKGIEDFGGDNLEAGGAPVSLTADAADTSQVVLIGTDTSDASQSEVVTLTGTTAVTTSASWNTVSSLSIGEVAAARTLTASGLLWNEGDAIAFVSDNAADTMVATIYGTDGSDAAQTETVTLTGTTPVTGTATWNKILGISLASAATGSIIVRSASNTSLVVGTFVATELYMGVDPWSNMAVSGSTVAIADSGSAGRTCGVFGLDEAGAAAFELFNANGGSDTTTTTFSRITGMALLHLGPGRTLTVTGEAFDLPKATYSTVADVAAFINALSGWTVAPGASSGALLIGDLDDTASGTVIGAAKSFTGDLAFLVAKLNAESQLVTAAAASGATGAPSNTAASVFLTGGIEGATAFANWQAALDLLRDEFVNTIVPLTDDAAVHAACVTHAAYMAGAGRKERDVVLGAPSGSTLAASKALAVALNTRHARLAIQDVQRYNTTGSLETFPPYFTACVAAGMQAGSPVGTPLTFKYLNVLDVIGDDDTYTLQDDAEELIQGGLLVAEKVAGVGFRWLRNVTTYLIDNNLAYTEASTNEAVNFAVYNFRTNLEAQVGKIGFAGTVNATLSIAVNILNQMIDAGAITNWRNLTITLESDVMEVDVELAPVVPVNFIKSTVHLVSAAVSAAA